MTALTPNDGTRYRWAVASRVIGAALAGYALTSAATVLLALLWPLPRGEAVAASTGVSFIVYTLVVIWAFSVKRLRVVWIGLVAGTALVSLAAWLLLRGAA